MTIINWVWNIFCIINYIHIQINYMRKTIMGRKKIILRYSKSQSF